MRGSLIQLTAFVLLDRVSPIDVQRLVGIHRDDDFSNECVDASFFKSAHEWEKGRHGRGYCCLVTMLCLTLCHPVDCSPPGSSVHGFPRQMTISFFREPSLPGIEPMSPAVAGSLYHWATRETQVWLRRNAVSFLQVSYFQENPNILGATWELTLHNSEFTSGVNAWGCVVLQLLLVEKTSRGYQPREKEEFNTGGWRFSNFYNTKG